MRVPNCSDCDRLWREYATATVGHIKLENHLKLAALEHKISAIERLTVATEIATVQREAARENIRQHEAEHGNSNEAIDDDHSALPDRIW